MCRGLAEGNQGGLLQGSSIHKEAGLTRTVSCELCTSRAEIYCQADDAYLCRDCDKLVHGANFLAHRHIRCILCNTCHNLTQRYLIGTSVEVMLPSIVSLMDTRERPSCNSRAQRKCSSTTLKTPILFL